MHIALNRMKNEIIREEKGKRQIIMDPAYAGIPFVPVFPGESRLYGF